MVQYFKNFGYIEEVIPHSLLQSLQVESQGAPLRNNTMISGLTGNGVPIHYNLTDNRTKVEQYVLSLLPEYENEFNYINSVNNIMCQPFPPLALGTAWFNFQKKYEFVPVHVHHGIYSFVIWLDIPYEIEEELSFGKLASCFKFIYTSITGRPLNKVLPVSKEWVGKILIFPSSLQHVVYPFYTSSGIRVSLSGNIILNNAF
jgi:hypothetical protein